MTTDWEVYKRLLNNGKKWVCDKQQCGKYKKQLQDLHNYVYVVDSTPNPCDNTYQPMFINCIIHKSMWTLSIRKQLEAEKWNLHVFDYKEKNHSYFGLMDTPKRRLLFEMLNMWWFYRDAFMPVCARRDAIEFRECFFKGEFAYLPEKFRQLVEETNDFNKAMGRLSGKEHEYLDRLVRPHKTHWLCFPLIKNNYHHLKFLKRLEEPRWIGMPSFDIQDQDVLHELEEGQFYFMKVYNYYDCLDRNLYERLYEILANNIIIKK